MSSPCLHFCSRTGSDEAAAPNAPPAAAPIIAASTAKARPLNLMALNKLLKKKSAVRKLHEQRLKEAHKAELDRMIEDHAALARMMKINVKAAEDRAAALAKENDELRAMLHLKPTDGRINDTEELERKVRDLEEQLEIKSVELENAFAQGEVAAIERKEEAWRQAEAEWGPKVDEWRTMAEYEKTRHTEGLNDLKLAYYQQQKANNQLYKRMKQLITKPIMGNKLVLRQPDDGEVRELFHMLKDMEAKNNDRQFSGLDGLAESGLDRVMTQQSMYIYGLEKEIEFLSHMNTELSGDAMLRSMTVEENKRLKELNLDIQAKIRDLSATAEITDLDDKVEALKRLDQEIKAMCALVEAHCAGNDRYRALVEDYTLSRRTQAAMAEEMEGKDVAADEAVAQAGGDVIMVDTDEEQEGGEEEEEDKAAAAVSAVGPEDA